MSRYGAAPVPISTPTVGFYDVVDPALPLALNEALVICNRTLPGDDVEGFNSVTNPSNWTITPVDPRIVKTDGTFQVPAGEVVPTVADPQIASVVVDPDFDTQYILTTVTPMENGVRYTFTLSDDVKAVGCEAITANDSASMRALGRGIAAGPRYVQADQYRDWAMTYFPIDPKQPVSTWRFDSTGDIGIQNNLESLQKRIYRRLSTKPGGFRHLPGYGVDLGLKTLFRSGRANQIANELRRQIKEEPDVLDAGVAVKLRFANNSPYVEISVRVQMTDRQIGKFVFPLTLGDS